MPDNDLLAYRLRVHNALLFEIDARWRMVRDAEEAGNADKANDLVSTIGALRTAQRILLGIRPAGEMEGTA